MAVAEQHAADGAQQQPGRARAVPAVPVCDVALDDSICGVLFLSRDHSTLFVIPHDHATTIRHHASTEAHAHPNTVTYGERRNMVYRIPLLTSVDKHGERVTFSQIMPQPRSRASARIPPLSDPCAVI